MALQRLQIEAEKAKKDLSAQLEVEINIPFVTADANGPKHLVTQMAEGIERFLPNLLYPPVNFQPKERFYVEMVKDFDRSSMEYIA